MVLIHSRLISAVASMLDGSGLQIAELAEAQGVTDPAYFSRFFKRLTGRARIAPAPSSKSRAQRPAMLHGNDPEISASTEGRRWRLAPMLRRHPSVSQTGALCR
jgi:hypothetical protein